MILQGQDVRHRGRFQTAVEQINQTPARAQITLKVTPKMKALKILTEATITETALNKGAGVFLALYENHLRSDVQAGENAGHTLHHQFVVRKWIGPLALNDQGQLRWSQSVSLGEDWKIKDIGVVACVLHLGSGDTLQAVALSLND